MEALKTHDIIGDVIDDYPQEILKVRIYRLKLIKRVNFNFKFYHIWFDSRLNIQASH